VGDILGGEFEDGHRRRLVGRSRHT
jgi:hypothetical protein